MPSSGTKLMAKNQGKASKVISILRNKWSYKSNFNKGLCVHMIVAHMFRIIYFLLKLISLKNISYALLKSSKEIRSYSNSTQKEKKIDY